MSGHSKWSTIKHQKAAADQKRGQIFSKLSRAISLAAREGADPDMNFKLRLVIEKAKEVNMPKDNIKRAVERGSGAGDKGGLFEVTYEGYGPQKIAVIVEVITDNKNRTLSEIKGIFEKAGGSLAVSGAVTYLFRNLGLIVINKPKDWEETALKIFDLGVENVEERQEKVEIFTRPGQLENTARELVKMGVTVEEKELVWEPTNKLSVDPAAREKVYKFLQALEDHDDVQEVFANIHQAG